MNDDFRRLVAAFHREQAGDHLLLVLAALARIDLNHLARVTPGEKLRRFQQCLELRRVRGVARNHQHERLDRCDTVLACIRQQLDLRPLMQARTPSSSLICSISSGECSPALNDVCYPK